MLSLCHLPTVSPGEFCARTSKYHLIPCPEAGTRLLRCSTPDSRQLAFFAPSRRQTPHLARRRPTIAASPGRQTIDERVRGTPRERNRAASRCCHSLVWPTGLQHRTSPCPHFP